MLFSQTSQTNDNHDIRKNMSKNAIIMETIISIEIRD